MSSSPGHKKWPDHKVREEHPSMRVQVFYHDQKIADSAHAIKVVEDRQPARFYIPREDIHMNTLKRSKHTYECPFKGTAHYYNINVRGQKMPDVAWSYESTYDEHRTLQNMIAFDETKVDAIRVEEMKTSAA